MSNNYVTNTECLQFTFKETNYIIYYNHKKNIFKMILDLKIVKSVRFNKMFNKLWNIRVNGLAPLSGALNSEIYGQKCRAQYS